MSDDVTQQDEKPTNTLWSPDTPPPGPNYEQVLEESIVPTYLPFHLPEKTARKQRDQQSAHARSPKHA